MHRTLLAIQTVLLLAIFLAPACAQYKITVDPNAPGSRPALAVNDSDRKNDPRLDQKITYQVKLRPISDLTDDLTALTGITFYSGRTKSDWRVREDCCTVWAKDVPLSTLMNSVARVMKFRWRRGGKAPNWTYRLVEDEAAVAKAERRMVDLKQQDREKRQARLDKMESVSNMTPDELAKLREDDPRLYLYNKTGMLKSVVQLFREAPVVRDAWLAGDEFMAAAVRLPSSVQQTLLEMQRAMLLDMMIRDSRSREWATQELSRLDEDSFRMAIQFPNVYPSFPIPDLIICGCGWMVLQLNNPRSEADRLRAVAVLRAYEEKRTEKDVYMEMKEQITAAEKKAEHKPWIMSYSLEPVLDHPDDDPALSAPLKKKIEAKTITGLMASLADVTGYAIVTDDFRGSEKCVFDKDTPLREVLEKVAKLRRTSNWNKEAQIIEFWDVNWYDSRNARVSKTWLEGLRRKLRETGTLDIDDLSQVAMLTNDQLRRNMAKDPVLKRLLRPVYNNRSYLKLYASMTFPQRAMLLTESGLAFVGLTPEQQQAAMNIVLGMNTPLIPSLDLAGLGLRITCTKEPQGKCFLYTLRAYTNLGPIPDQARFWTPVYVAPPEPKNSAAPSP